MAQIKPTQPGVSLELSEKKFLDFLNKGESPYDYEKILLRNHFQRIMAVFRGENPPPYELEIQPSPVCDLKCKHCFGRECTRLSGSFGKAETDKLAQDIQEFEKGKFRVETIKFCGTTGEPLVNPDTAYAIENFASFGKFIRLFTNGMGIMRISSSGKLNLESILRAGNINVSLDAGRDKTIKRIKGNNADYALIMGGVEALSTRRIGKKPAVVISYVITEENYFDVENATCDAKNAGADLIRFKIDLTAQDRITGLSRQILEIIERARDQETPDFKVVSIHSDEEICGKNSDIFGRRTKASDCYTSHLWSCVGPDFQLYPCGHSCHGDSEPYGDLHEASFKEVWNSRKARKRRESLPCDGCLFCPPFGSRTNDFLTFVSSLPEKRLEELHEKWS